ncbi:MAG: alpha/beta hydrolase [Thermodesulfobacteriota bacterium]
MRKARLFILMALLVTGIGPARAEQPSAKPPQVQGGVRAYKNLAYVAKGHRRQVLDLYVPAHGNAPLPLIIWIHGGAWKQGSKDHCPPLPWVQKGYVVASINYRLCQHAQFPAQIEDCKAAVRWLRAHAAEYRIDPDRIVAWGDSAGGHLASLLGTAGDIPDWEQGYPVGSSRVQVVIDWYGRADLACVSTDPAYADSPIAMLLGGSGPDFADEAEDASPIHYVSRNDPAFLIMHGDRDGVVPVEQSLAFTSALREAGVKVRLVILKGAGHGGEQFLAPEQVAIIDAFLQEHLGLRQTAQSHP